MQWDDSPNGGFTTGTKPWLAVNPNYSEINVKAALADRDSIYHYYRSMIDLRRKTPALVYGDYKDLDPENPNVFAYTRSLGGVSYLVVLNFSASAIDYALSNGLRAASLEISNLGQSEEHSGTLHLKAWEARVYKVQKY
jgi:oligo-1,6-glucosidase